jgi:hypothetical protein
VDLGPGIGVIAPSYEDPPSHGGYSYHPCCPLHSCILSTQTLSNSLIALIIHCNVLQRVIPNNGTQLQAIPLLLTILDVLPTYLILGAVNDLMFVPNLKLSSTYVSFISRTPVLYDLIFRNIQQVHAHLASLTVIADVGHYVSSLTFVFERV